MRMNMKMNNSKRKALITLIPTVIIVSLLIFGGIKINTNVNYYNVTVTDKIVKVSEKSSKYLIFVKDTHGNYKTFENTDSIFYSKWNSSDVYARIKKGESYKFKVVGYRVNFLSMYENIIEID